MRSRCMIRRNTGRTTQDESTGLEVPVWDVVHADLPCRVSGDGGSRTVSIGGATIETATRTLHLPADTRGIADGDLAEVVSGEWAGRVFRVVEVVGKDQATALRLPIVESERPEEW